MLGLLRLGLAWLVVLAGLAMVVVPAWAAADDFLPPEQAFKVSAKLLAADRAEVLVQIAPGYYVYRDPFRFKAEGATLGAALIPPGKVKFDENFQKNVETYRGDLRITVPLANAAAVFKLVVVSQGCADAGLCYPPMSTELRLDLAGATSTSAGGTAPNPGSPAAVRSAGLATPPGGAESLMDSALLSGRLWQVVGVFFGLGLLLSLTPCVLPMLPILSALIVGAERKPSRLRGLVLAGAYSLGMALVYTGFGVAAGLAGEGFAAALQTPWAIAGFTLLLVVFALSMFDVYQLRLPARFTGTMTTQCNRLRPGRLFGVFLMGGVSALIVSPCVTAPLAGALLFISQSGDVVQGGSALFAMASGMSVPLLLLGVSAGRWVPRAGAWMHGVKRLFGLMLLGVALWVAQPILPVSLSLGLWGLLLLGTGFLLLRFSARPAAATPGAGPTIRPGNICVKALGFGAMAVGLAQIVGALSGADDPLQPLARLGTGRAVAAAGSGAAPAFKPVSSSAMLDAALREAGGRPVMLDFYADWCVSCKEMERFTFSQPDVAKRLGAAVLLKADVTANTADQRALMRRFKLFGPPGTLFFDARGQEISAARVVGFQGARRFADTLATAGL